MEQRLRARAAVLVGAFVLVGIKSGLAASPQVPSLPTQLAEYFKYAVTDLPNHYKNGPVAASDNTPNDNPITDAGATLGRVLFYDRRLSHNDGVACASCHRQENGFSEPNQFSTGFDGQFTGRHSPGISNAKFYESGRAFWDERAASLEAQALEPIQSPVEMGMNLGDLVVKLSATKYYPQLFQAAFGSPEITPEKIGKTIAQFERAMVSYQSKYDRAFTPGNPQPNFAAVFTPQELQGEQIFHGAGRCGRCHATNAHVGDVPRNIGLDLDNSADEGAGDGKFKTPSLRNIAVRGRFMHDGRFSTLRQVIEFYNTGIQDNANLDPILDTPTGPLQLGLNLQQINALLAYLNTLTDTAFLTDIKFSDPFITLPGDYNGDGEVGPEDYDVWRANYGDTMLLTADGNGDMIVDAADYTIWRNNFGRTWLDLATGSGGLAGTVPEPSALLLTLLGIAAILAPRRNPRTIPNTNPRQ
jgi:cytochrome c peroxidase